MTTDHEITMFLHFWARRGIPLPDPTHYPNSFMWYVKMYRYYQNDKVK